METMTIKRGDGFVLKQDSQDNEEVFRKGTKVVVRRVNEDWEIVEVVPSNKGRDESSLPILSISFGEIEKFLDPIDVS